MTAINGLLNWGPVSRIRRNHALEHASLHVLAREKKAQLLAGHSDVKGMRIIGNVATQDMQQAVEEALTRLKSGEKRLAYHPNCGTNFSTSGALAGLAAWSGMLGGQKTLRARLSRLPFVILLVSVVLILTRPLGPYLQRYITTDPNPGLLRVVEIQRHDFGNFVMHRIVTADKM